MQSVPLQIRQSKNALTSKYNFNARRTSHHLKNGHYIVKNGEKAKDFKKGMSHAKKVKKHGTTLGSMSVTNTDTITFIIQYWKDGIPYGGPTYDPVGNKEANKAVREGMATYPELDSVQKVIMHR